MRNVSKALTLSLTLVALALLGAGDVAAQSAPDPVALFNAGQFAEAAKALEPLAQSNPNEPGVHYLLGRSYLKLDRTADAVRELEKAVELKSAAPADPKADPKALFEFEFWLANAYVAAKDWPKVVAVLDKAAPRIPDDTYRFAAQGMRGYANLVLERYPEAIRDLEANRALKKNAGTLASLGKAYYGVKDFEKSVTAFREAATLEPKEASTWILLGNAELAAAVAGQGEAVDAHFAEALKAADRYLALKNNDAAGLQLKAKAALGLGEGAVAEGVLIQLVQADPGNCQAQSQLGRAYVDQKKWAEAERALQAAAKCQPSGPTFEALGFVYLSTDKLQEALEAYQKANSLAPSPSAQDGIKAAQARMEMQAQNAQVGADKAAWEAKRRQHEKEYEEYLKKREEWEKKRNESN
jgi:tetratricopeptide (TPR) repeat protein